MIRRRLVTIPRAVLLWVVFTVALPPLMIAGVIVDAGRKAVTGKPWTATRLVLIGWIYIAAEVAVIVVAAAQWIASLPFGRRAAAKRCEWSYWLQARWVGTVMAAMQSLFRLEFHVAGSEAIAPGPVLVLFRHASIMDNLLPHHFISRPTGIRLRWVLKKELLSDPALDIGGNRMPNYFVDRDSTNPAAERMAVAALGEGMGTGDGVLLFPEGTRFSRRRRERRMAELAESRPDLAERIAPYPDVLPPRSGGVLALLDHRADVVVAAHAGFEQLRGLKEIWRHAPVGRRISLSFRRIPAGDIPTEAGKRLEWLFDTWAWVGAEVARLSD